MEYWIRAFVNIDFGNLSAISYTEILEIVRQNQKHIAGIWVEKMGLQKKVADLEAMLEHEKNIVSTLEKKVSDHQESINGLNRKLNTKLSLLERITGKILR